MATRELIQTVVAKNTIAIDDVASILLTMTPDLTADFPAKAVRSLEGWQWIPLMCATELAVPGALPRCIRILIHVNTDKSLQDIIHVYLGAATALRPDLVK